MGLGAQDNFGRAQDFLADTGVVTPDMLWDPSFATWQIFGTRYNSQMLLMSGDLTTGTDLFYGFGDPEQAQVIAALPQLS